MEERCRPCSLAWQNLRKALLERSQSDRGQNTANQKLETALIAIRDFEPVTNGNYAVDTAIPEMRRIAIAALSKVVPAHRVTWEFTWVNLDFMLFGAFKAARKRLKLREYERCAWCREPFKDDEMMALAGRPKGTNVLLCQDCATNSQSDAAGDAK